MKQKKKKFYKRLEPLITRFHARAHPWPDARDVEYVRYARAVNGARFCYWVPWGWLPWSGIVIRWRYRREK